MVCVQNWDSIVSWNKPNINSQTKTAFFHNTRLLTGAKSPIGKNYKEQEMKHFTQFHPYLVKVPSWLGWVGEGEYCIYCSSTVNATSTNVATK